MANTPCNPLELADNRNGSVSIAWSAFPGAAPDSYNVYVNGVLNQNVASRQATITGLVPASYNGVTVTPAATYTIRVAAVKAGVETAVSANRVVTVQPTSVMLVTPMKRPFPFPNTAPGG